MERDLKVGCIRKPHLLWFASLFTVLLMVGVANADTSLTCSSCHGTPPRDSGTRDPNTGGFPGNHQDHIAGPVPAGSEMAICNVCHNMTNYSVAHQDHRISFSSAINGSPKAGALYSGISTFKNQTSLMTLGACSNVNCHFETDSPSWGTTTKYSYTSATVNDCNACHGMPPAGTSPSYARGADGSHTKHNSYYSGADNCVKCHIDHTAEANKFAHATSAGNRTLNVTLRDPANALGGSYSGTLLTSDNYLPSKTKATFGTCANLYCHSDGLKASAPYKAKAQAQWGTVGLSCDKCHGYDGTSIPAYNLMSSGRHKQHIANGTKTGLVITCEMCHAATVSGGVITASTRPNHVNKNVNVKFTSPLNAGTPAYNGADALTAANGSVKTPGTVAGNCANLYCHSNGNTKAAGTPVYRTVAWGTAATLECSGCHGDGNNIAHPNYSNGGVGTNTANTHKLHVEVRGYACNYCHVNTTTNTSLPPTAVTQSGQHLNGGIQVSFDTSFFTPIGTVGYSSGTCANTYCHSNGIGAAGSQAVWGGALDCRGCHGGDASHASVINTNKHRIHVDPSAPGSSLGLGTGIQCAACHLKTINTFANNTTITSQANHVNKLKDYSGARAGRIVAAGQCANVYCHSNGAKTAKFRSMTGSKLWTNPTGTLDCKGCHGYETTAQGAAFNSIAGEPNYATGAGRENSHQTHVNTGANSTSCAKCHDHTVNSAVVGKFKDYTAHHVDGNRDVNFSATIGGTWNGSSCNNTACHGAGNPQWGVTSINCDSCHAAAGASFSDPLKQGAHKKHYESDTFSAFNDPAANLSSTTQYRFTCASCHYTPSQHSNLANARTTVGKAEVYFGLYSATGRRYYDYNSTVAGQDNSPAFAWTNGGTASCNTTYCHSDGKGNPGAPVTWGGSLNVDCSGCHANETSPSSLSGAHQQHIANNRTGFAGIVAYGCADCHAKTVGTKPARAISDKTKHVNNFHDYSSPKGGGSVRYSAGSCSNIYCHSNGKGSYQTIAWTGGSAQNCTSSCHTVPSVPTVGNAHGKHLNFAAISCDKCHSNTVAAGSRTALRTGSTTHINGTYKAATDVSFATMSSSWKASFTSNTCNNIVCHSNGKGSYQAVSWTAGTLNCSSCHPNLGGVHLRHMGGAYASTLLAQQNLPGQPFMNFTSNRSSGSDPLTGTAWANYSFGCASCHPYGSASHINGTVDVALIKDPAAGSMRNSNPSGTYTPAVNGAVGTNSVTCENIYCHSNGSTAYMTTPAWNQPFADANRCSNRCHGNAPGTGAHTAHAIGIHADDIFNGTSGKLGNYSSSLRSSAHGNSAQATTISCNICHYVTTEFARNKYNSRCSTALCHGNVADSKDAGRIYSTDTNSRGLKMHVNGKLELAFNPIQVRSKAQLRTASFNDYTAASGFWTRNGGNYKNGPAAYDVAKSALDTSSMWNGTSKTCSNVACHMSKPVTWGAGSLTCEACHSRL